jgi:uncharacterized protein GlcG (DUF336 family)
LHRVAPFGLAAAAATGGTVAYEDTLDADAGGLQADRGAAEAEARKNNWNVCVAIVDDGGHLLHLFPHGRRDAGELAHRVRERPHRAETRRSTAMWEERIKGGRTAMLRCPASRRSRAALPIVIDGECIGAVGVSGVQSHEDEQIAKAGIRALTS